MAYNTIYKLKIHKSDTNISEILSQVQKSDFDEMFCTLDEQGHTKDSLKWYDHEDDLIKLSLLFPDIVFDLYGEGDESGDIWHKYFLNGKVQRCFAKIIFDEFDVEKLSNTKKTERGVLL